MVVKNLVTSVNEKFPEPKIFLSKIMVYFIFYVFTS